MPFPTNPYGVSLPPLATLTLLTGEPEQRRDPDEIRYAREHLNLISSTFQGPWYRLGQATNQAHGQGSLARRNIPRGTCILTEQFLFDVADPADHNEINREYQRLNQHQRSQFDSLSPGNNQNHTPLARFQTNALELLEEEDDNSGNVRYGVFQEASRFNHDCVPNAHLVWNRVLRRAMIFAIKNVPIHKEIFIYYISENFTSRYFRRVELRDLGFRCQCTACETNNPFHIRSERRRLEMWELDDRLENLKMLPREQLLATNFKNLVDTFIDTAHREGLCGHALGRMHTHLAFWHEQECISENNFRAQNEGHSRYDAESEKHLAIKAARGALGWYLSASGERSRATRKTLRRITELHQL